MDGSYDGWVKEKIKIVLNTECVPELQQQGSGEKWDNSWCLIQHVYQVLRLAKMAVIE